MIHVAAMDPVTTSSGLRPGSSGSVARVSAGFQVSGARRYFGATRAVDGIDLTVERGTINALMGANGSGKSTLAKMLAGVLAADSGQIDVGAGPRDFTDWSAAASHAAGFRFVHQDLGLFPALSVADNLAIGYRYPTVAGRVQRGALHHRAEAVLHRLNARIPTDRLVEDLSPGEQALVGIGRALQDSVGSGVDEAKVLVLDEPTAALGRDEATMLLDVLTGLAAAGETVLYIGHRLAEIFAVANRIVVMRDGKIALDRAKAHTSRTEVINVMVTAEPGSAAKPATASSIVAKSAAVPLLECRALALGPLTSVDIAVRAGRITGIAGLQGVGRTLLLRTLFGDLRPAAGTISIDGRNVALRSPRDAVGRGVALIPADRAREGIFPGLSVRENMLVAEWGHYRGRLLMDRRAQRNATAHGISELAIRTTGDQGAITDLSGGNQQKVVVARWLLRGARILLMDEPTQGVDVVARRDLWTIVREMVFRGGAALVVSSDLEELLEVSDEILVLHEGTITDRFDRGEVDEEMLNRACQGVHRGNQ